jgi:hypothetical protein
LRGGRGRDIDRGIVAKLESHIRAVSDWELLKLCEVVGVSPNEFLGVEALPRDADKLSAHLKSRKMKQALVQ